jgi:hypothetical protein
VILSSVISSADRPVTNTRSVFSEHASDPTPYAEGSASNSATLLAKFVIADIFSIHASKHGRQTASDTM